MSHPSVCPKCKYNRPIFLSYCPHCRDLNPNEKENARKEITGKYVKYYTTNNRNDRRVVTCEGTNCATDGCRWDSEKQICTPCGDPKGTCKVTDAPDNTGRITWKDVIDWAVKIIAALIGIFK